MAVVRLRDMSLKKMPGHWKQTMPRLQELVLERNILTEPPEFPWNNSTLEIYRGLRRMELEDKRPLYWGPNGPLLVERNHYVRGLYLGYNNIEDLSFHEFRGFLHVLSLKGNGLRTV